MSSFPAGEQVPHFTLGKIQTGVRRRGPLSAELFSLAMNRFADTIDSWNEQYIQDFAEFVFIGIVTITPVKTGRARANWQVGLDEQPSSSIAGPPFPDPIKPGRTVIAQYERENVLYIVNNVVYIQNLEEGSSPQAPAGITGPVLAEAAVQFEGYIDALDNAVSLDDLDYEI